MNAHKRLTVVLFGLVLPMTSIATAQAIRAWPARQSVPSSRQYVLLTALAEASSQSQPGGSHWASGGIIGAVVVGAAGFVVAGWCDSDSGGPCGSRAAAVAVGASIGFIVGALIGAQFPKHGSTTEDTPP